MKITCKKYGHHRGTFAQWLKALLFCRGKHTWLDLGDPCWCGSDNCSICQHCKVQVHD